MFADSEFAAALSELFGARRPILTPSGVVHWSGQMVLYFPSVRSTTAVDAGRER